MHPKVSVLMPVYNGEKYLKEAIDSILNQTFTDFEFLIIDDGSRDNSVEIINSYQDPRIKLVQNKTNLKLITTLNKGLALAKGEYIARMDCDDFSLPQRFEKQISYLDIHNDIGVLGTGFELMDARGNSFTSIQFPTQSNVLKWSLFFYCPIAHPTVVMRRSIVNQVGGYNSEAVYCEDYDLWIRVAKTTQIGNLPDVLVKIRKHDANVTNVFSRQHQSNCIKVSQLLISKTLDKDISINSIKNLKNNSCNTKNDINEMNNIICDLYEQFSISSDLSSIEKKIIRRDLINRIFIAPKMNFGYLRVLQLAPLLFVKRIAILFIKLVRHFGLIIIKKTKCFLISVL